MEFKNAAMAEKRFYFCDFVNKIEKWGDASVDNLSYYGVDGTIKYSFGERLNLSTFDPYLGIGGGYTWVDDIGAGTLNGTLGFNLWFSENIGLTVQSSYKHAFEDYLSTHFQHTAGISIKFGGKDTDEDGIYDKDDACPEVWGLEAFMGCPDSDGDGIEDSKDDCPNEAGLAALAGCPDADSDGIAKVVPEVTVDFAEDLGSQINDFYPHHVNSNQQLSIDSSIGSTTSSEEV